MFKSRIPEIVFVLMMSLGLVTITSQSANAWPNPAYNGCLGGTVKASQNIYSSGSYIGNLRIYQSCGNNFHAYFVSNGIRRSLGVQITNAGDWRINAWRWMDNQYAVWTDMIPGGCVYAQVYYYGQWLGGPYACA